MPPIPPLPSGYIRLAVLLEHEATPGQLAQATTCNPEQLGLIQVEGNQALIDVAEACVDTARQGLLCFGPTQITEKSKKPEPTWRWLRLAVGRNHGFTLGQFRRLMERSGAGSLGKIHLNNTHTLVGLRDDCWDTVCEYLAEQKVNGKAVRPSAPQPGETYDSPIYIPSSANDEW